MIKRIVLGLIGGVVGYVLGAVSGGFLVSVFSPNTHDRSVEAAMTGAFVFGPLLAVVGLAVGLWRGKQSTSAKGAA